MIALCVFGAVIALAVMNPQSVPGSGTFVSKPSAECPGVIRVVGSRSCSSGVGGCTSWLRFFYRDASGERQFFILNQEVLSYSGNTLKLPKNPAISVVMFDRGTDGVPIFVNPSEFSESEFRTVAACLRANITGIQDALAKTQFRPNFIGVIYADGNKEN